MLITTWLNTLNKRWRARLPRRPRKSTPVLRRELERLESRVLLSAVRSGFTTVGTLGNTDDSASAAVPLGFSSTINFFGPTYSSVYVNNNGNLTFKSPNTIWVGAPLSTRTNSPMIAPFLADVDASGIGSGVATYGTGTVNSRPAFAATWNNVGYYERRTDKLNSFQVILIERFDTGTGNFDIEFNYDQVQWEAGNSAGGVNGLGGNTARVGYTNGSGTPGRYFELAGSAVAGSFLDANASTSLVGHNLNSGGENGRYVFSVRTTPPAPVAPVANANGPYTVAEGGSVVLSSAGSIDPDGTIVSYQWDMNYNGVTFNPTPNANVATPTFSAAGIDGPATRTVALRVTDNSGLTHLRTAAVTVNNVNPTGVLSLTAPSPFYLGNTATVGFTNQADPAPGDFAAGFHYAFDLDNNGTFEVGNGTYGGSPAVSSVSLTPAATGSVTVRGRIIDDDGGFADRTLTFTVNPVVNIAPTFNAIATQNVKEDATPTQVTITGVSAGSTGEDGSQTVTLSAVSSNPALIPDPSITGTGATRTLTFQPVANLSGSATITVTANDGQPSNATFSRTFLIVVNPVNDQPSLDAIANQTVNENSSATSITLTGIGPGTPADEAGQTVTVSAVSSNPLLIPHPTVTGTGATRTLSFQPAPNANGEVTITVTAQDSGGTANEGTDTITRTFTITVNSVNGAPSFDPIGNVTVLEDSGAGSVSITGVSPGVGSDESGQAVTLTAVSSDPSIVPDPTITGSGASRTLDFAPVGNANGTVTITVTATDSGSGSNTFSRTFLINVTPKNDAPTLDAIADPAAILEDATLQTVALAGLSVGPANESGQALVITATSNNTALIPHPSVSYFNPSATGSLTYTPQPDASGTAVITVTVTDNGGTSNGGGNTVVRTFTVTVTAVNDGPTLDAIDNPAAILEDTSQQTVSLAGIGTGSTLESQTLSITAVSSNPSLIPDPTVTYTSPNATGTLTYTPVGNANGSAVITVTVTDSGDTSNGGVNTVIRTFTVNVDPVNDQPTLGTITDPVAVPEDSGQQTVSVSGISAGIPANESGQTLTLSAVSSNPGLIPNPTVTYTSGNPTGTLSYTPVANANGFADITVTLIDNGGTANGGLNSITRTFRVNVTAVNDLPLLNAISDPAPILEDAGLQTVSVTGISAGLPANEAGQTLTLSAVSNNPGLIPDPTVTYTSGNPTGTLTYTPVPNANGTTVITVTLSDGFDSVIRAFTVSVTAVNDAPNFDSIANRAAILEDAGQQTVSLTGITAGAANETAQTLTISAVSSNPSLIPHPTVNYTSPAATGTLTYMPVANASGTATVTVTLSDGIASVTRTFDVVVTPVNDEPTLSAIANPAAILEDAGMQTVALAGISAGMPNESSQTLTLTAVSSNPGLIPHPTVTYTSPNSTALLSYTPVANVNGTATITVTLTDNGGTDNTGDDTIQRTFVVTVTAVNDPPVFDSIANQTVTEDPGTQTVTITGVRAAAVLPGGAVDEAGQSITFTAVSSNTSLIPDPTITGSGDTRSLTYTPVGNANGTATITVTESDGFDTLVRTFQINVTPVNDAPTLNTIGNQTVAEDAPAQTVSLTGIGPGGGADEATQMVTVSAVSSNQSIVPNPTITGSGATRTLNFQPLPNANGTVTVTVTVSDGQGPNGTVTQSFTITVNAVNDAPTLDPISNRTVNEDSTARTVLLTGIGPGGGSDEAAQPVTVSATSSNPAIVPHPSVTPTGDSRTLTFQPAANATGTVTITVTADDGGSTVIQTFTISVTAINDAPVFNAVTTQTVNEDAASQDVSITGVGPGGGADESTQVVTFVAISSDPTIVPHPTVSNSGTTRTLSYQPVVNANGTVTITVTATDNGGTALGGINSFTRTFTITVNAVNDAPTLNAIANRTVFENAALQFVSLSGIFSGGGADEANQSLTVTATSSATSIIPNPTITGTGASRVLNYLPNVDENTAAGGPVTITVTVTDNGGTALSGINTFSQTFTVTVIDVNDIPRMDPIPNPAFILEDAALQTINLTGIAEGPANESSQLLTITALSNNTALITNPVTVGYTNPDTTGTITYTPVTNANGAALITVTVEDDGGELNGGVDTLIRTFTVNVTPVNDQPVRTAGTVANLTVFEDSGISLLGLGAVDYEEGPSDAFDELALQTLTYTVTAVPASSLGDILLDDNSTVVTTNPGIYTLAQIRGMRFRATLNANTVLGGAATFTYQVSDDGGTANLGVDTLVQSLTITVNPINDQPVRTAGAVNNLTVFEDSGLTSLGLGTLNYATGPADAFDELALQSLTYQVTAVPASNVGDIVLADGTTVVTVSPGIYDIDQLRGMQFRAASNGTTVLGGPVTFSYNVIDSGDTANTGVNTLPQSLTVTVTPINDQPVRTAGSLNNLVIDEDAGTVSLGLGTLNYATGPTTALDELALQGLTYTVTAVPNPTLGEIILSDTTVVTVGTEYELSEIRGMQFKTTLHANGGPATFSFDVMDDGGIAFGGVDTLSQSLTITVNAVNDAPVVTVPGLQSVAEDTTLIVSGISIVDVDTAGATNFQVTLSVLNGTLTLSTSVGGGLAAGNVTGNGTASVIATGTLAQINTTLTAAGSVSYLGGLHYNGSETLTVTASDNGNTGSGGTLTDTETIAITVTAVNDAPEVTVPDSQTTFEDIAVTIPDISIIDVDAGSATNFILTLGVTKGTITLSTSVSGGLVAGDLTGNGTATVTATATLAKINATLAFTGAVTYLNNLDQNGLDELTVTANDNGNTGSGGALSVSEGITIVITAVNDAPVRTTGVTNNLTVLEDSGTTTLGLSGITYAAGPPTTATDETAVQTLTYTVTAVPSATLGDVLVDGATVVTVGASYSLTQIRGMQFTPAANANGGPATFSYNVIDNGGTANSGFNTLAQSLTISVTPVNDEPTLDAIANVSILEDASLESVALTGITSGPANEISQVITITATSSDTSIIPHPTVIYTSPNTIGSLSYTPVANAFGTVTITVTVTDNAGIANLGDDSFTRTFTITVMPVNDAPTLNAIANPATILANVGAQTINLSGITFGPANETGQVITITATSNNPSLIPNPTVSYTSPNATGSLSYTPVPGATGTATITVLVQDSGLASNGGLDSFVRTFVVNVASMQFDFNANGPSPTFSGYVGILTTETYTAAKGYGWQTSATSITAFDRGALSGLYSDLRRDGHKSTAAQTFQVNLANNTYYVNVTAGDFSFPISNMTVAFPNDTLQSNSSIPVYSTSVTTSAQSFAARTYQVQVTDGSLEINFSGSNWALNGIEIRPVSATPTFTFSETVGAVTADGTSIYTITATTSGLPNGTPVTVASTLGTILTSQDASTIYDGVQVMASSNSISFQIQAPTGAGTPTLTAAAVTGGAISSVTNSAVISFNLLNTRRFDFNGVGAVTSSGFIGVTQTDNYSTSRGYGWNITPVGAKDRTLPNALNRDGHIGTAAGAAGERTFQITAVAGAQYDLRFYIGDFSKATSGIQVQVEGGSLITVASTNNAQFTSLTNPPAAGSGLLGVTVSGDGILDFTIRGSTAIEENYYWILNGLDVAISSTGLPAPGPQTPAGGVRTVEPITEVLTESALAPIVTEAVARWMATGITPRQVEALRATQFEITDLDDQNALGLVGIYSILIDDNGSGYGWYVDAVPSTDDEFDTQIAPREWLALAGQPAEHMDLLTVVVHELGHILGLADLDPQVAPHDLMTETLGVGTRRLLAPPVLSATSAPAVTSAAVSDRVAMSAVPVQMGSTIASPDEIENKAAVPFLQEGSASSGNQTSVETKSTESSISLSIPSITRGNDQDANDLDAYFSLLSGEMLPDLFG